jgi:cellulose synthase operon protein C
MTKFLLLVTFLSTLIACNPSADDFAKKGEAALLAGDNQAAVLHLRSAVSVDANSLKSRELLSFALERTGDFQALEQQLRKQIELGGNKDIITPKIAAWLLDRNENQTLIKEFGDVKLTAPESNATLSALLSIAYTALRRIPDAERTASKAGLVNSATQLAAAQIQLNKGSIDNGKVMLADAQRFAKENKATEWWIWRGIARGWQSLGEREKSLNSFNAALKALPSHFGVKGELGEYYISLGKIDEAKAVLTDLKTLAPKYYRTVLIDALLKIDEGNQDEAYELATKVLAQVPESESASLIAANIDLTRNNISTAESRAQVLLQRTPNSIGGQRLSAVIEAKKGNTANAERILEKTIDKVGQNPELMVDLAQQKLNLGKTAEAKKLLESAIAIKPDLTVALSTLSDLLLRSGAINQVAPYLKKAMASSKPDVNTMLPLFNLAIKTKQYAQAELAIEKTQSAKPNDPNPTLWRAILARERNDEKQAYVLLLASLNQNPTFYPALTILKAQSLSNKSEANTVSELEKRLNAAIASKTKDARIYLDMLTLKRRQNLSPKELSALGQKFVIELPESVNLRKTVAELLVQSDQKKVADSLIDEGNTSFANMPGMLELAARWAEASGQNGVALTRYEQLSKLFPENLSYALKRGQLLFANQRIDDGIEVFKRAIVLRPEDDFANRELAFALFKQGKKPESLTALTNYGNQPGKTVPALLATADLHFYAKEFSESLKSIEKAIRIETSERTVGAKIRFLDSRGEQKEAEKTLDAWLKSKVNDPNSLLFAATRASQQNQHTGSVLYIERLLKVTPGNPYLLNDLAFAQASLGLKQALQTAELANNALPDQPNIMDTLAFAQTVNGKVDDAEKTLKDALQTDPNAIAPLVRLAELLKSKNNVDEAKQLILNLDINRLPKAYQDRVKAI